MRLVIILSIASSYFHFVTCFRLRFDYSSNYLKNYKNNNLKLNNNKKSNDDLINWFESYVGKINFDMQQSIEDQTLFTTSHINKNSTLIEVPKNLCIYSNPDDMSVPIAERNIEIFLKSLDENQWRTRLAILFLSADFKKFETYFWYLHNLKFHGIPISFDNVDLRFFF